jgi:hypothetical protein
MERNTSYTLSPIKGGGTKIQKTYKEGEDESRGLAYNQTYPLRSPHRSPALPLPFDAAAPDIECVRFRPTIACFSPSPLEGTRTSAGTVVVIVVELGMTKYCPIARRTAPFAALAMPPSIIVGAVTSPPFNAGGRFLYYMCVCDTKKKKKKNSAHARYRGGARGEGGKGERK